MNLHNYKIGKQVTARVFLATIFTIMIGLFVMVAPAQATPPGVDPLTDPSLRTVAANADACTTTESIDNATACASWQLGEFADAMYGYGAIPEPIYALAPDGTLGAHLHPVLPCMWSAATAAYCAPLGAILVGAEYFTDAQYPYVAAVLAHEYGHHLQAMRGGMFVYAFKPAVPFELQADCIAGSFIGYSIEQGWMSDDVGDKLTDVFASSPGDENHGTGQQRGEAFHLGLTDGLSACDPMVTDYLLIR